MVAGLTIGKKKYVSVEPEMTVVAANADRMATALTALVDRDAEAYAAVSAAYKLPRDAADRDERITRALLGAAEVPLETARLCAEAAELAVTVAAKGNTNAITDAGVAALLAAAGCRGAVYNVKININSLSDRSLGSNLQSQADELLTKADMRSKEACDLVERALSS
jgi:glutamate formiminotransferase/formiminotetrahydrofolate cyclodeaminase